MTPRLLDNLIPKTLGGGTGLAENPWMHPSCYSNGISVNTSKNSENRLLIDVKLVATLLEVKACIWVITTKQMQK